MEIGFIIINNRCWKAAINLLVNEDQSSFFFGEANPSDNKATIPINTPHATYFHALL